MIPIRDANPSSQTPFINYLLIVACIMTFFYELTLGESLQYFMLHFGLVPSRLFRPEMAVHFSIQERLLPFFTYMFLHGGWLHLLGNMWVLYIFGDNVESRLGHGPYLLFYVLCGWAAALVQTVFHPGSTIPTVGASGAIAGVMGAYFLLYPKARILTLVPIFFFFTFIEIPAFIFLGLWFLMQFLYGTVSLFGAAAQVSGVAWWAHAGGFVAGLVLIRLLARRSGHGR